MLSESDGHKPVIVSLSTPQVRPVGLRAPQHAVMFDQVPGVKQVSPEESRVSGQIAERDVEVTALLGRQLQTGLQIEIVTQHHLRTDSLPVQTRVECVHILQ